MQRIEINAARVAVLLGPVLLAGCNSMCSNQIVQRVASPDGSHSAVLFQRDCGATTGFSSQVSVLGSGDIPSGAGNALVADDDHGAAAAGDWGGPLIEMRWLSPTHLLIRYAAKSRLFTQTGEANGVRISYEAMKP